MLETEEDVAALLEKLKQGGKADLMGAPKVLVMPRQRAELSVLNSLAYVKDWRAERVHPGDRLIADPVIDRIQEGQVVNYWLYPVGKHSYSVDLDFKLSKIQRPIPTMATTLEGLGQVSVSVPTVHKTRVTCSLEVPDGGGALFSGPSFEDGYVQGVLFVVKSVNLEEVDPKRVREVPAEELLRRRKDG